MMHLAEELEHMAMTDAQRLLTREEAAQRLRVSIATFDRLRYAGLIRAVHLAPKRVGFTEEELDRYIREHMDTRAS